MPAVKRENCKITIKNVGDMLTRKPKGATAKRKAKGRKGPGAQPTWLTQIYYELVYGAISTIISRRGGYYRAEYGKFEIQENKVVFTFRLPVHVRAKMTKVLKEYDFTNVYISVDNFEIMSFSYLQNIDGVIDIQYGDLKIKKEFKLASKYNLIFDLGKKITEEGSVIYKRQITQVCQYNKILITYTMTTQTEKYPLLVYNYAHMLEHMLCNTIEKKIIFHDSQAITNMNGQLTFIFCIYYEDLDVFIENMFPKAVDIFEFEVSRQQEEIDEYSGEEEGDKEVFDFMFKQNPLMRVGKDCTSSFDYIKELYYHFQWQQVYIQQWGNVEISSQQIQKINQKIKEANEYMKYHQKDITLPTPLPNNLNPVHYIAFSNLTDAEKDCIFLYFGDFVKINCYDNIVSLQADIQLRYVVDMFRIIYNTQQQQWLSRSMLVTKTTVYDLLEKLFNIKGMEHILQTKTLKPHVLDIDNKPIQVNAFDTINGDYVYQYIQDGDVITSLYLYYDDISEKELTKELYNFNIKQKGCFCYVLQNKNNARQWQVLFNQVIYFNFLEAFVKKYFPKADISIYKKRTFQIPFKLDETTQSMYILGFRFRTLKRNVDATTDYMALLVNQFIELVEDKKKEISGGDNDELHHYYGFEWSSDYEESDDEELLAEFPNSSQSSMTSSAGSLAGLSTEE